MVDAAQPVRRPAGKHRDLRRRLCQPGGVMPTVGSAGAVRSMRIVLSGAGLAGVQLDGLPAVSTARNWTSVWPSAATVDRRAPPYGADQVEPPSVDVRRS